MRKLTVEDFTAQTQTATWAEELALDQVIVDVINAAFEKAAGTPYRMTEVIPKTPADTVSCLREVETVLRKVSK